MFCAVIARGVFWPGCSVRDFRLGVFGFCASGRVVSGTRYDSSRAVK